MKTSDGIVLVKDRVAKLMEEYPELRDNDTLLFLAYMVKYHYLREVIGPGAYNDLKRILLNDSTPKFESISRARRKIQEEGIMQGLFRFERKVEAENVKAVIR